MRVERRSASHLDMLVDRYLPDCNFINLHALDVEAGATALWAALPSAARRLMRPRGVATVPLRLAALMRGDLAVRRRPGEPPTLREGEVIGDPFSRNSLVIERVDEGREIVIKGSHRYADYVTNIYLEPLASGRTRIYNVTRAGFSRSLPGRLYLLGVRVFHDPYIEQALARLKRFVEAAGKGSLS